jgi:molecular chaperone DnaK (HSP70)
MTGWAIDLGTTNTGIARWDKAAERPRLLELATICRQPGGAVAGPVATESPTDHLEAPLLVPSAVHLVEPEGFLGNLGTWGLFRKRLWGRHGLIGRQALERNATQHHPAYAPTFKGALAQSPLKPLARLNGSVFTARDVARVFLRELLREVREQTGERIDDLVMTAPVDAFEAYRAELKALLEGLGVRRVRFLDEPVAAAIGYGLGVKARRHALVVDFGAGTLDLALVALSPRETAHGSCHVIAKGGRAIGGNLVDHWLVETFCERLAYPLTPRHRDEDHRFWYRLMLDEARRVKESVFFNEGDAFYLTPPEDMRAFEARLRGDAQLLEVSRDDIVDILTARGLHAAIDSLCDEVLRDAAAAGVAADAIDDVLMVGGSTLLPGIHARFAERFGRGRVRAWQPFEAVAYGASAFAADRFSQSDFIVHDYAFVTYDATTHAPDYTIIVPKGTRIPTPPDLWKKQLVPTCARGVPETTFALVISEIGEAEPDERRFAWDAGGQLHKLGGESGSSGRVIVPLNAANPTLGELKPPHAPSDRAPRLEISFGVNAERWLATTVVDLKTGAKLMDNEPVVRLL